MKKQTLFVVERWGVIHRLLQEREQQLELSTGSYQAFAEHAQTLLGWLQEKLAMDALLGAPPADLEMVEGYQREILVRGEGGGGV